MAFKRSAVRSRLSPPNQYNPNLLPIGDGFGFIVSIEGIKDWYQRTFCQQQVCPAPSGDEPFPPLQCQQPDAHLLAETERNSGCRVQQVERPVSAQCNDRRKSFLPCLLNNVGALTNVFLYFLSQKSQNDPRICAYCVYRDRFLQCL